MPNTIKIAGLLCGMLFFAASSGATTPSQKAKTAPKPSAAVPQAATQAQPVVAPVAVQPPAPPPMPSQLPAVPPKVTLSNGQLSIVAENSNLGDVLSAVKNLTGAGLDVPPAANSERIVVHLGPGHSQEVLQQLFSGSKFDYIILGANDSTGAVSKIILTPRSGGAAGGTAVAGARGPNGQPNGPRAGFQPPPEPEADQDSGQVEEEIAQPEPPPPQNEEVTPPAPGAQQGIIGPGGQAANPDQQTPKTPEQLLQELQRQQQQQQQQQQGQPGQRPERGQVPPNSQ